MLTKIVFSLVWAIFLSGDILKCDAIKDHDEILKRDIYDSFNCLVEILELGAPEYGIPRFDNFAYDDWRIDITKYALPDVKGYLHLKNFEMSGTSDVQLLITKMIHYFDLYPGLLMWFQITFPEIKLNTDYTADFKMGANHIFGSGTFNLKLTNFMLKFTIYHVLMGELRLFKIWPFVGSVDLNVTGAYHDEAYSSKLSYMVSTNYNAYMKTRVQGLCDAFTEYIRVFANMESNVMPIKWGELKFVTKYMLRKCTNIKFQ